MRKQIDSKLYKRILRALYETADPKSPADGPDDPIKFVGQSGSTAWIEGTIRQIADVAYAELESEVEQYDELLAAIALYIDWRYVTRQLTRDQKELFADAVERNENRLHGPEGEDPDPSMAGLPSYTPRWWRDGQEPVRRPAKGARVQLTLTGTVEGYYEPPKDDELMILKIEFGTYSFKTLNSLAFYVGDPKVTLREL